MPRAQLSPVEVAAFRERLAGAATHLFAEQGYAAVTMRAVADALGVSAMTPYRYVAGKEELFGLVRADAFRRFAERLEAALGGGGDPVRKLRRLKQAYIQFALDHPDAYRIMFELSAAPTLRVDAGPPLAGRPRVLRPRRARGEERNELEQPDPRGLPDLAAQSRRAFACLHDTVAAAVAAGQLDGDPLTLAHLLWASTHGLVSLHLAGKLTMGRSIAALAAVDHELPALTPPRKKRPR